MDIAISDYVEGSALADSTDNRFFFNSGVGLVRAEGVSQRLTLPILSSHFDQEVDALFKREMDKGVASPILVGAIPFDMSQPAQLIVPTVFDQVEPIKKMAPSFIDNDFYHNVLKHSFVPNHSAFLNVIEDALVAFKEGSLKKIVLSKILELELDKVIDSKRLLANMMAQNPNAYHFSVPLENSVLVGASPELLLRKTGNRIYSNPLAGSAKRLEDKEADRVSAEALLNSDKDQYEHRLVVDAIRSSLLEYVEELQVPDSPSLISTPTMWHLSTEIEATLPANNTSSIFDLIRSLHPTPAMCGTPTLLAQNQIEKFEPHDRGCFSGLVGWTDAQGNGEWAIAIRCAETSGNKVKLFAGAGVVPDSKPESEWLETSAKMRTMMNALGIKESIL